LDHFSSSYDKKIFGVLFMPQSVDMPGGHFTPPPVAVAKKPLPKQGLSSVYNCEDTPRYGEMGRNR